MFCSPWQNRLLWQCFLIVEYSQEIASSFCSIGIWNCESKIKKRGIFSNFRRFFFSKTMWFCYRKLLAEFIWDCWNLHQIVNWLLCSSVWQNAKTWQIETADCAFYRRCLFGSKSCRVRKWWTLSAEEHFHDFSQMVFRMSNGLAACTLAWACVLICIDETVQTAEMDGMHKGKHQHHRQKPSLSVYNFG